MTAYFVTRHRGAVEWARACGIEAEHLEHLDPAILQPGDVVLGTLPVAVVAEVCLRDARYMHLTLDTPPQMRGKELTAGDMEEFGAKLEEFEVRKV